MNPGLPHCRQTLDLLSHQGNPREVLNVFPKVFRKRASDALKIMESEQKRRKKKKEEEEKAKRRGKEKEDCYSSLALSNLWRAFPLTHSLMM